MRRESAVVPEQAVQVRSDFRSTILWLPDVKTDADGAATVKVKYPDSLTTWSATARVATTGNQFGIGSSSTRTKQPLIVRLQAPRFFVVGDQVTVSAVINNNTDQPMSVSPALSAEGLTLQVALFIDRLPEGVWQLSYELRAEAPEAFHALPVLGHAMYVPEIRTNGSETRIRVVDQTRIISNHRAGFWLPGSSL